MKDKRNIVSYAALDTNVFISMASVGTEIGPDCKKQGFYGKIRDMKRLAQAGHLKFVITPSVLSEIARQKREMNPKIREKEIQFLKEELRRTNARVTGLNSLNDNHETQNHLVE
jgi:hypothetical protein